MIVEFHLRALCVLRVVLMVGLLAIDQRRSAEKHHEGHEEHEGIRERNA